MCTCFADATLQVYIDDVKWEEDFLVQVSPTSAKLHC